ncbi:hydrogenase subunit MbhD domain-containing protein [Loktanella sp. SALINAS62]|uniref:hydrogenase subunit MbhD domain-containing protein n=1 Tax=Loktanella sp. SALINAS62 TaxID=2706124 RepID=UPI001B8AFDD7|nr:hydrogenase subunit MbhD domain-containing protein [Loktanella sp. SALINAS62]MBS1304119.1 DUF4040 domain-containing protein [Loktanella sp. SALINAS62]
MMALAETGFDLVLCAMIATTALLAIGVRDQFGAVVLFVVYSVFLGLGWLRLGALDIALAEVALGAGLTGLLLFGAHARLPASVPVPSGRAVWPAACAAGGSGLALGWAFLTLPEPVGLQEAVAANLGTSGVENPVTAVLLNFRSWDTLIESIVLLAALIGVWSVARDDAWGGQPGLRQHARHGGVLANFGRLLPPIGFMIGVYLFWAGSSKPGGAFQAGTVLAAVALVVFMGGAMRPPLVTARWLRLVCVAGPAVFLAVGLTGAASGVFLGLRPDLAKPLILAIEAVLTFSIAASLALSVIGPPEDPEDHV